MSQRVSTRAGARSGIPKAADTTEKSRPRPTIRDVARVAGVGVGTVSRVVNNHPSVNSSIRQVVEKTIAELGYEPDALASSMRRTNTRVVGCIVRESSVASFAPFISAAEATFKSAGSAMFLGITDDRNSEMALLRTFAQRRIDGILFMLSDEHDAGVLAAITQYRLKSVFINREMLGREGVVLVDHRSGLLQAMQCLIGFGHRRIALLTNGTNYPGRSMIDGFKEAHKLAGLSLNESLIRRKAITAEDGFRETWSLISGNNRPTAIIAGAYSLLVGAMRAINSSGLMMGRDISLITDGDSDLAELVTPAITVIRFDRAEMGRVAAQMLIKSIETPATEQRSVMRTELVLRGSCQQVPKSLTR